MRETPYNRLKKAVLRYIGGVDFPCRRTMWVYQKAKLDTAWSLLDLYERVAAADQLGYDVKLRAAEEGLFVEYVKRHDPIDYPL